MNFRDFKNLSDGVIWLAHNIPVHDLVIGVPRSGMTPASMLATLWGSQLGYYKDNDFHLVGGGERLTTDSFKSVLVLDDTVATGHTIDNIRKHNPKGFKFAAVFVEPTAKDKVDFFYEEVESPRLFSWNMWANGLLERACVDIDGILNYDIEPWQNDGGTEYDNFINNVSPKFLTAYKIHSLVTARLEKYRKPTENWLATHGVNYDNLIMLQVDPIGDRDLAFARYKANYFMTTDCLFFLESDEKIARYIKSMIDKPVLCTNIFNQV